MTTLLTRFYRHYKNKPYKYIGVARHSETLEELALYESLYDNQLGRIWVRPKEMFFEQIQHNGQVRDRFQQIPFTLKQQSDLTGEDWQTLSEVYQKSFGEELPLLQYQQRLHQKKSVLALSLYDEGVLVAFKIGYADDDQVYYSWLGAVHPDYRGMGLASELMRQQHDWCAQQGFRSIRTKSQNQFPEMLRLNIKFGFQITEVVHEASGKVKVIMQKEITKKQTATEINNQNHEEKK